MIKWDIILKIQMNATVVINFRAIFQANKQKKNADNNIQNLFKWIKLQSTSFMISHWCRWSYFSWYRSGLTLIQLFDNWLIIVDPLAQNRLILDWHYEMLNKTNSQADLTILTSFQSSDIPQYILYMMYYVKVTVRLKLLYVSITLLSF